MKEECSYKKSKEQKKWENYKLRTAGFYSDKNYSDGELQADIDLIIRDNNFKRYTGNNFIDYENKLFKIGNVKSKYYEKHKSCIQNRSYDKIFNDKINISRGLDDDVHVKGDKITSNLNFQDLPVYRRKDEFLHAFENNNILVVTGETGCGKSTMIPKLIYDKYKYRIAVTQPRIIATKSLYNRMKSFYEKEVGFSVQFEHFFNSTTKIKFMTEGILLRELLSDPLLYSYDVVICDEVHERSVNLDIILGLIKLILNKRKNLKFIMMSATLQVDKFCEFFNCPFFAFDGKQFPVEIKYLDVEVDDYIEWTVKKILHIYEVDKSKNGHILVFMSGKEDISMVYQLLKYKLVDSQNIIPLYSEILNDVYDLIFNPHDTSRKCIISTNIAEASITIPNIKYVIDSGFQKINVYDFSLGNKLIKYPISKENAVQRSGRAGRTGPGVCFRMYTKDIFDNFMDDSTPPEIIRTNICNVLLLLAYLNILGMLIDDRNFKLITVPDCCLIENAYEMLLKLEAVDKNKIITQKGKDIINYGIDPLLGNLIVEGIKNNCVYEMILLSSILSTDLNKILSVLSQAKNALFYDLVNEKSDFLTLIFIFKEMIDGKRQIDIFESVLKNVQAKFTKTIERVQKLNIKITRSKSLCGLELCILKTFFYNIVKRKNNEYLDLVTLNRVMLSKNSVCDHNFDYLIYYKIFSHCENNFICFCAAVDPNYVLKNLPEHFTQKASKAKIKEELSTKDPILNKNKFTEMNFNPYENLYERFEEEDQEDDVIIKKIKKKRV